MPEGRSCPKCRDVELVTPSGRATRVLCCPQCRGSWLPRNEARLEAVAALLHTDTHVGSPEHDEKTGLCPEGHGILIRARVDHEEPFYLDKCGECAGIWFDQGEWSKLARSHLLDNIDILWDPTWRDRTRRERAEQSFRDNLRDEIGNRAFDLLLELVDILKEEPSKTKSAAVAFLREELDRPPT